MMICMLIVCEDYLIVNTGDKIHSYMDKMWEVNVSILCTYVGYSNI